MAENAEGSPESFDGLYLKDVTPPLKGFWFKYPHVRKLNFLLLSAILSQTVNGFDGSMLNGLQSLPQWTDSFGTPTGPRLAVMVNGNVFGILGSMLFSSYLCEKLGRRYPIMIGSLLIILGAALQGGAQSYGMFVGARLILGLGLGIVQVCSPLLVSETAYPTQRGKMTAIWDSTYPFGALIAAGVTRGTFSMSNSTWSWRIPSLLQGVFSIVQLTLAIFVPESPRWLVYQNRAAEAEKILTEYHGAGDPNSRLVRFQMVEITTQLEIEKSQSKAPWTEWLKTAGNRRRLLVSVLLSIMIQFAGNALISYYLSKVLDTVGITDSSSQLSINVGLQLWGVIIALTCAMTIDRLGRRGLLLIAFSGMCFAFLVWTIISAIDEKRNFADKGLGAGVVVMIFVFQLFYHLASPTTPTYIVEIAPFSLRSKASVIYQLFGNLTGVFNNFVNPIALDAIAWKYYLVYIFVLFFDVVFVYFMVRETKGLGLEETKGLFDNKREQELNKALSQKADSRPHHDSDKEGVVMTEYAYKS